MENASKALIIAAAILIAIVLITLGVYVIGVGQDQIKNSGMSDIEITTFNQKFTKYEGTRNGSEIKTLIQEVNTSNVSDKREGNGRSITLVGAGDPTDKSEGAALTYQTSTIASSARYSVSVKYDSNSGYVNEITITKKTNK